MKLTKEEKLKYVRQYINGERIATPDGYKNRRAFMSSLAGWAKRYKEEGEAGLDRKKCRSIPLKTKLEVVRRIRDGERNSDVAKETGFSPALITHWCGLYFDSLENGVNSVHREREETPMDENTDAKQDEKSELKRLREENEYLRTENAVLKNLRALRIEEQRQKRKQK